MLSSPLSLLSLKILFVLLAITGGTRFVDGGFDGASVVRSSEGLRGLAGALAGAMAGAKLGFALQFPALFSPADSTAFASVWIVAAGISAPGALAGGALGMVLATRAQAAALGDALLPALLVFLLIVDLGALTWTLTEPGFGAPARHWGMNFGDGIKRHPVMLYDAAAMAALLWAARATYAPVPLDPGVRAGLVGSACFGVWFLLGFLKPPFGPILMLEAVYPRPMIYAPGFTGEQWLCLLAMLALGLYTGRTLLQTRR